MAKKPTVTTLQSGFNSTEVLNENFENIRDAFDNTLSLDGSTPNAMQADLDLNGNNLIGATGLLINGTDYLADVEAAKAAALVAQAAAELAESNAETAEVNAEASETAAGLSATAAATSATNAGASETAASTSATASATSATNSSTSASQAATSASAAAVSEGNAATSETNAANSATSASGSASAATTQASAASASATNAATSASNAATSETNAAASKTAAAASATNAAASESAAATSATNAATSESNAATSASTATTQATNAATSASTASTSATNAATSETNAASSASSAASSASSAQASKDAALAALDSFDDRYLGQKASDPTLDNDGNALVAGALYFNTTDDVMKVYEGSVWVAAYASLSGALLRANNLSDVLDVAASRTNLGLATVAATGAYTDLSGKPVLGTAAATASTDYATAAQGTLADSAVQPNDSPTFAGLTVDAPDGEGILLTGGTGSFSEASYLYAQGERGRFGYNGSRVSISDYSSAGSTSNKSLSIELGGAERLFVNHSTGDISFYEDTGTTPKFFWDASAERLGLGTVLPSTQLDVVGGIRSTSSGGYNQITTTSIGDAVFDNNGNNWLTVKDGVPANAMRIDSSGNVGIGTSSPLAALSVGGGSLSDANLPIQISTGASGNRYVGINKNGAYALLVGYEATADQAEIRNIQNTPIVFKTNDAERMRIDASGNLLVGTTSGSDKVTVNGTVSATNFNTTSDATLKTNVETLTGSLDAVNALRGVSFDWIESGGSEVGFIAQEVEEVLPEVVSTNDQGIKSVKYGNMVAVLVEALKEQQAQIDELKAKLEG